MSANLTAVDPAVHAMRWKTLAVLSLSLVIIGLDTTLLNVALPTLQEEFHASPSRLQWMVDSYLLVLAGLLLVFGMLGDRFGRKLALQAGVSIFGLASLGALVADSADQVIAVRAVMGIGAALIMPATLSIIANVFIGDERGKAIGIWAALAAIGIGLGPLAGGLLLEWFDWWSVFLVNVPFVVLALALGIPYVPESRDPRPGRFDLLGATLSTAGFSILVYAIIEAPEEGWLSGLVLGALAGSVVLLVSFIWWQHHTDHPMLDLGFFRSARFSVGTAVVSVAFFALMGGIFALTQFLQFARGYSAIEAGAIMSPMTLGLMVGAGSSSKLVARLGVSRVVAVGLTGLAIMLALTALWGPDTGALVLIAWFLGLALFTGWVMAPATDAVVGAVPAAKSGVASATNTVARMVSGALGVAIIGSLISSLYSDDVEGKLGGLPPQAQAAAEDSVGAAHAVAAQLPPRAGSALLDVAGGAFTDAMGVGMIVAAALAVIAAAIAARFLADGERSTARQSVTVSTTIDRPREAVFDYLDDLAGHEAFTDHFLVDWSLISEDSVGVGAGARMRAKGAGRHAWLEITVVESVRPERTVEHGRGGKDMRRRTSGTYRLEEAPGDATNVFFTNAFEPVGLTERLQAPLARAYLRKQNARALHRLKAILEGDAAQAPPERVAAIPTDT